MTVPIKIQCVCGQAYAFDVEPVHGRMPYAVACPSCGVDGTEAANEILAQSMPAPSDVSVAPLKVTLASPVRASAVTASQRSTRIPGQMDRSQARKEARAKVLWGDKPNEITGFLMA